MTAKLRFAHASMEFGDTTKQKKDDLQKIFGRDYDVITGTEAGSGSGELPKLLKSAGKAEGYKVYVPGRYDTWVAVKRSLKASGTFATGTGHALDRSSRVSPTPPGRWGDKGVVWVEWNMGPTYGRLGVASVHYLTTKGAGPKHKAWSDKEYARVIGEWARLRGAKGEPLSVFLGGDFNLNDKTTDVFKGQPFKTCWDDLGKWPSTGHGNIDAIARYVPDKRVTCVGARVLDDKKLFLNTDHWLVEAEYEIKALPKAKK